MEILVTKGFQVCFLPQPLPGLVGRIAKENVVWECHVTYCSMLENVSLYANYCTC